MRIPAKLWKGVGVALLVVAAALVIIRTWIVPSLIAGAVRAQLGGDVAIRSWWLNGSSAGVTGLVVRNGSDVWASADRVATDLSLGGLLRGRVSPGRVELDGVKLSLELDRDGRVLTKMGEGSSSAGSGTHPKVVVNNAEVTVHQEGRPEMVVKRVHGRLAPYEGTAQLNARSDDPNWGPVELHGELDASLHSGRVTLASRRPIAVDPQKVACIPLVPPDVWTNVLPHGLVDAAMTVEFGRADAAGVHIELGLRRTMVKSSALSVTATRATGKVIVDGALVRLEDVEGEAIGGSVGANGTLDFTQSPPRFDLGLKLTRINVADTPKSWQLDEAGITGRLSGNVQLKALLASGGVDLTGSSGEAEVTGGTIQGIPVKSLKLVMHAQGNDLKYESKDTSAGIFDGRSLLVDFVGSALRTGPRSAPYLLLLALQGPAAEEKKAEPPLSIRLPKTITTQIELQDVEMAQLIDKAKLLFGMPLPIPVTGKLDLKATATIPIGELRRAKDYAFHGDLTLRAASLFQMDVGTLTARIDLADGVLALTKLRGRLVNRPDGGPDNPPEALPPVPADGPLPSGAFRIDLRAEIAPLGRLTAKVDGDTLPLGELAAPALPRPTPLSGLLSLNAAADANLAQASDPNAWHVTGRAKSAEVAFHGTILDSLALTFALDKGELTIADLAAQMDGQPLKANVRVGLDPPHAFTGQLDVAGWSIASIVSLVPGAPRPAPVTGSVTAQADARGTLAPIRVETKGKGQFDRFHAGPVPLGDVPFQWRTEKDVILVSKVEARPFGGRLQAEARVPTTTGRPVEGAATVHNVDTARLSDAIPGEGLKLSGKAGGQIRFSVPADVSRLVSTVRLSAPDLTVQGIPAEQVQAAVSVHQGVLRYDVTADSLGGKVKFQGDFPLTAPPAKAAAEGELRAAGFTLGELWKALGVTGAAARLAGEGAVDANLRIPREGPDAGLWVHGLAEFRSLRWGEEFPLGHLRGTIALTPTSWWAEPLDGELLGGPATGHVWGSTVANDPRRMGFEFRIDRAPLERVLRVVPALKGQCQGYGTLRVAGRLEDAFRASADLAVPEAQVLGLPVNELRVPVELVLAPATGTGRIDLRRWSARFAGGHVRGDAAFRVGEDEAFQAEATLSSLDIESVMRLFSDGRRNESGRVSGRVSLSGPRPGDIGRYRGKVELSLADASLISAPIFRAMDKFLGSAGGGLFEVGTLNGTIVRRQLLVDQLTLAGRVVQIHATGSVGFDGQLSLDVLLNTNQIIPETGQALVRLIPGLGGALGRRDEANLRVANYLSNRLLKLHVGGTLRSPAVAVDPTVVVVDTAVAFFAGVLKLPLGLVK